MATPRVRIHNPKTIAPPTGYSHVAEVHGGRLVFIAGQIAKNPKGELVGRDDYRLQADQVFQNIGQALESVGATFDDLVKLTYYVRDASHLPEVREVRDRYVNTKRPPASTAVQVSGLASPEFLLEVEAIASVE
jgi:enamine deaminase RidA (YjgF/YER057c/UK114 family)